MSDSLALRARLTSTVFFELVVAITGVLLVFFILAHLAGNLLLLLGPAAFNEYAARLESLGELLWVMRVGLFVTFVAHISTAIHLGISNRKKRAHQYLEHRYVSQRTLASRTMLYSGILLFCFLLLHLTDFTLRSKEGPLTIVAGMNSGEGLALYGLVWNKFANPIFSLIYIAAMTALGFHLTHAVSSVFVTLGVLSDSMTRRVELGARLLGAVVAVGFSLIPLFVLVRAHLIGV
ncbi:MAG: succinate dehydrogenase [Candidatus Hydrogenedentes bacterium]|nr:succinate dehydrogenase [Candidatus Hydrogenedentota bacterium]